jgi:zinc protease
LSHSDIRCETLGNGLTVLLQPTRLAPVAEVQIWANVGSGDERAHESGLAHFHEHMLFKGTARRGVGEVAGEIEGAGGRINAYTSLDVTVYHATLPAAEIATGVDVLCDAVRHSAFDPVEIEREIEVVLEEIRRGEDSPGNVLSEAVFAEAYRVHPYRAPVLGTPESVSSFDRERVRAFFERWYRPDNLTVVAVGDIDCEAVLAQVGAAFAGAEPGAARRERAKEPAQSGLRSGVWARPFERANLELAYAGLSLDHTDCPYLDLLSFIFGGCDSSRLVQHVKERDGLADRIDAGSFTPRDPGLTSVSIETGVDRAARAIESSVREVERLRSEPVSGEELERARVNFLASEHFERESVTGIAYKLGGFHVTGGDYRIESRYLDAIRHATATDLHRVAQEYLRPERLTVGAVVSDSAETRLSTAEVEAAVERGIAGNARVFRAPRATDHRNEIHSYALDGGAALHVIERHGVPVVAGRAAFLGGLLSENADNSGLSHFLIAMWLRGTRSHSAADFARASENVASEVDSFVGRSSFGATFETPADALEPTLELFSEVLLEPAFDADEIERERSDTLAAIERREDRLGQKAFLLFAETHYAEHPYRQSLLGTADSVAKFDAAQIVAHHEQLVRAPNLSLAIAGDVDPDEIAVRVSAHLSGLPEGGDELPQPAIEPPPREIREAELRKDRAQAHLVIGFRGLTIHDEERHQLDVLSQLLAGQGGRLFLDLRDRQSLAYAVNAVNVEGVAPGYFAVYIATAPEKLDAARKGLLNALEELVQAPVSDSELDRAKRYLIGNHAIGQQRNAVQAAHAALDGRYGLGPDSMRHYPEHIAAIGSADLLRTAQRVIDLDAYTLAVIRP